MAGAVAGIFVSGVVARILEFTGSYVSIFAIASVAYLFALAVIHLLVPRLEPARIS
jgi:ACS family hexuronate transporter-like MFS transporter